jgi:hypothetical protein
MIIIGQQKGHRNEERILSSSAENLSVDCGRHGSDDKQQDVQY